MHHLEIPEKNWEFNFPEDLGECDARQYAMICRLLFQYHNKEIDFNQFKVAAVYQLLGMQPDKESLNSNNPSDEILQANIYDLTVLLESFFIETDQGYTLKQDFFHNPMPAIPLAKTSYYGPADYFRGCCFGEYMDALNIMGLYNATQDHDLLYDLAAVLYRPKGAPYNDKHIEKYSQKLRYTDFGYIYGVYIFMASFQHYINTARVNYEGKEVDLSILYKSSGDGFTSSLPGLGMKGTSYMLAETGILGNLKEVKETDLWEVLFLMYDIKKGHLDQKAREKQQKTQRS